MSDLEFEILDELYFVQSFDYLQKMLNLEEIELKTGLADLLQKAWIKCYDSQTMEVITEEELDFENNFKIYHYLATKEGLLVHNSK